MQNSGFLLLNVFALFLISAISIIFFGKQRQKKVEDQTYACFLIINICMSVSGLILGLYVSPELNTNQFIIILFNKIYLISLLLWIIILTFYTIYVSFDISKIFNKFKLILKIFTYISILLIICFPLNVEISESGALASGLAILFTYFVFGLGFIIQLLCIIINHKDLANKKYIPIYLLVFLGILILLIQMIFPSLNYLVNPSLIFISFIMYHTIENPDVVIIRQLNVAKDQAEKANKAKSEFLSNMSHEIRTPLNAIVGFSECLIESPNLDSEAKDHAKDIVDASNNLLEIVNGILDISKIEANKMEVVSKEYNPKEVFNGLCKLIIPRIGSKPIEFRSNITEDLPGILKGDVGKLKQVVLNILTNAAKYTDRGEIIFSVSCINRIDTKKCSLNIAVKDTGRGIKKEDINKLFNKFERFDEDQNTSTEGTGLGLAITKSLTEMMGGRITVSSNYGEGSTFRINIEQDLISMEAPVGSSEEIEIDYSLHTGKRILVVDDSKINLKVANNILKPYNFTIVEACSGFEALELAETGTFDLILMDIMMPKMNGVECLRRLKEIPGFDIPVVALTADAIEGQDEKYIQAGFNDYLSKPIDRYQLNRVLNKYLGGK